MFQKTLQSLTYKFPVSISKTINSDKSTDLQVLLSKIAIVI
jgi:hypothetical protein